MRLSRARLAVTFTFFAHGALFGTWVARIPAIKDDLGLGEGELGLALLGGTLGAVACLPLSGWMVSRAGGRTIVATVLPIYALLLALLALAPSLALLALTLLLFGATAAAVDVAMNANGLELERSLGRPILSSLHAGWSFGGLAGAVAGGLVAGTGVEPLPHFAAAAALIGAAGLVASRALLAPGAEQVRSPAGLRRPPKRLVALGAVAFCGLFAEGAAADWSAVYIAGPLDASERLAALGFGAFSLAMAVFRLAGDPLTARWGPVTLTRRGGTLAGGALGVALVIGHPLAAVVALACMGAGVAAIVPVAFRAAGSLPPIPPAVGIAALTTVGYSAFVAGPPAIGLAAEIVGLPAALGLVVVLLGALVVLAPWTEPGRLARVPG